MNRTTVWRIAGVVMGIAALVLIGCAVAAAQGRLWGIGLGNAARGWFCLLYTSNLLNQLKLAKRVNLFDRKLQVQVGHPHGKN